MVKNILYGRIANGKSTNRNKRDRKAERGHKSLKDRKTTRTLIWNGLFTKKLIETRRRNDACTESTFDVLIEESTQTSCS